MEVLVLIEGIDPLTSNSLQAKYSYKWGEVRENEAFCPCVYVDKEKGGCVVDITRFHATYKKE